MCCSLRAGVITIAVLTIVFAGLQLIKSGHTLASIERHHRHHHHHGRHGHHGHHRHHGHHGHHHKQHRHHHKHHKDSSDKTTTSEMLLVAEVQDHRGQNEHMDYERTNSHGKIMIEEKEDWYHKYRKYIRCGSIFLIVVDVISILTAGLMLVAATEDVVKNQGRRHFVLPFMVWYILKITLGFGILMYLLITYRQYITYLILPAAIVLGILGLMLFFLIVIVKYFKSLSVEKNFSYAQMEDIKKEPLA